MTNTTRETSSTFRMTHKDEFDCLTWKEQQTIRTSLDKCVSGKHLVHIRLAEIELGDEGPIDLWLDNMLLINYGQEPKYTEQYLDCQTYLDMIDGKLE